MLGVDRRLQHGSTGVTPVPVVVWVGVGNSGAGFCSDFQASRLPSPLLLPTNIDTTRLSISQLSSDHPNICQNVRLVSIFAVLSTKVM